MVFARGLREMFETCVECGVPTFIGSQLKWLNHGDIVNAALPSERLAFMECEFFDPMVWGVEKLIGYPVERIVTSAIQMTVRVYIESLLPPGVRDLVKNGTVKLRDVDEALIHIALMNGYGKYEFLDMRFEQDERDYYKVLMRKPFSVFICAATHGAAMEAILGYDHDISYEMVGADTYEVVAFPSPHPPELKERIIFRTYDHVDGELEFERCETCGVPWWLSSCRWSEEGVITNTTNGRRMALLGPNQIASMFDELEKELGEDIPRVVVESQKNFTLRGFLPENILLNEQRFREELALRGLGVLERLRVDDRGLEMRLENSCLPLVVVGTVQGMYEKLYGRSTGVSWELADNGDLEVTVEAA
ncbi:MAG: hypothetical protein WHT46_04030 [Candidatus Geothermincolales bacterium]